jgi:hypothetical protein
MKRRTAKNSTLLAHIKSTFNEKVYKEALRLMNVHGKDACIQYVVSFYREEIRDDKKKELGHLG